MTTYSLAAAAGALLGLLIVLALWASAGGRVYPNRVLAGCIALSTAYLLSLIPQHSPDLDQLAFLAAGQLTLFLFAPGLYFYVRAVIDPDFRLLPVHLLHTLPLVFIMLDQAHMFAALAGESGTLLLSRLHLLGVAYYVQTLAYLLASMLVLSRYRRLIAENYSSLEGITLRWLRTLVALALILSLLGLCFALGRLVFDSVRWPQRVWSAGMVIAINYLIAFFAMSRPILFNSPETEKCAAKYETSSLTADQAQQTWQQLEALMATNQPHLQNQLKISDLAGELQVPVSHLSQIINQVGDCSFFKYVNRYRVEAARCLLRDTSPGKRTMLDIALSSGFNSESAFYKQFRALEGRTPRQFQLEN